MDLSRYKRQLKRYFSRYIRPHWIFWVLSSFAWFVYAAFVLIRHRHLLTTGYDLGIFDQLIWNYSHFHGPSDSVRGLTNLLSDHFHPLLVVLAPLYWIWDDVRMLLLAQVTLVVAGAIPLYFYARSRLGETATLLLCILYWTSWAIYSALAFDFHEVALAVPLLSLAAFGLMTKRFRPMILGLAGAILVKEDMSLVVAAFGLSWAVWYRQWRRGLVIAAVAAAYFMLVTRILMPALSPWHTYSYWTYGALGPTPQLAIISVLRHPFHALKLFVNVHEKRQTLLATLLPFGFVPIVSPLVAPILVLLAERFFSTNSDYWGTQFQYGLTVVPLLAFGLAYYLQLLPHRGRLSTAIVAILLAAGLFLPASLVPNTITDFYRSSPVVQQSPEDRSGEAAARSIPATASVTAQNNLVPYLSHREDVYVLGEQFMGGIMARYKYGAIHAQYVIYSTDPTEYMNPTQALANGQWRSYEVYIEAHYSLVRQYGAWQVWRRT